MLDNIDKEMTLDALNIAINKFDRDGNFCIGDALFELMNALKSEWRMEDDD